MKPDTSRWRDQDQYEFYDALPVEGVAWECLRRNASYQASFDDLVAQGAGHLPFADDVQHRWGLRFPGRPFCICNRLSSLLGRPLRSIDRRPRQNPDGSHASLT